jgi:hypothetical protein
MSTLCLTPFDIFSIDSSSLSIPSYLHHPLKTMEEISAPSSTSHSPPSLITIVVETAKEFLSDYGPTREAASVCLSSMLTRPDADKAYLSSFLNFSIQQFESYTSSSAVVSEFSQQKVFLYLGILFSLNQIFKKGHREKLLLLRSSIQQLLSIILKLIENNVKQVLERKFLCKLIQRIGMILLTPIEAKWRYQKGYRSMNLFKLTKQSEGSIASATELSTSSATSSSSDGEDIEIPEEIEEILDKILTFLSDKATIVRWSAAKGIGRLTMRLTKSLGLDIVNAVISQFDDKNNEDVWHGCCLALAELSRRGLLLPDSLSLAVPVIIEALTFDLQKGQHYVGANIRDAACYVCWAFARAYSPTIMKPFISDLSLALLTAALFDREINCRRAASAAFQENVGRQGNTNFINGIEIITIADFFSVSNRIRSFLELSSSIVSLNPSYYFYPFIEHLKDYKINHWDREIRELSSKTIGRLVLLVLSTSSSLSLSSSSALSITGLLSFANTLLSSLLVDCLSDHLYTRHGAILTVSRLLSVLVLHFPASFSSSTALTYEPFVLSPDNHRKLEDLIPDIEKKRHYRGKGGECIRESVCLLIETLSRIRFSFQNNKVLPQLIDSLNDHLKQPQSDIQNKARNALRQFLFYYFSERRIIPLNPFPNDKIPSLTVNKYLDVLKPGTEGNVAIVRGYIMALGVMPDRFVLLPATIIAAAKVPSSLASISSTAFPKPLTNKKKERSDFEDSDDDELPAGHATQPEVSTNPETKLENDPVSSSSLVTSESVTTVTNYEIILNILDDYSNNTKLINGEYDAETCKYAIESLVELTERLIASYLFEERYLRRAFSILWKGCEDYSIDKRGDTGSWVRIASLKGLERLFSAVYGNLALFNLFQVPLSEKDPVLGTLIQTSYGIGIISSVPSSSVSSATVLSFRLGKILCVTFSSQSLGYVEAEEESQWLTVSSSISSSPVLVVAFDLDIQTNHTRYDKVTQNLTGFLAFFAASSIPLLTMKVLLKQLSEKLDSVRSIAGNILERILFQRFGLNECQKSHKDGSVLELCFPDEDLIAGCIEKQRNYLLAEQMEPDSSTARLDDLIPAVGVVEENGEEQEDTRIVEKSNSFVNDEEQEEEQVTSEEDDQFHQHSLSLLNWHRPNHVFGVVVPCLQSSVYFHSIFSGLILSIGGLTEAIVKSSATAFLLFSRKLSSSQQDVSSSSSRVTRTSFLPVLLQSIEHLFQGNFKNDRIILPLLKTTHLLIKENIFELFIFPMSTVPSSSYDVLSQFYSNLILSYLFQEMKATNQVQKLFLLIDLYVLLLTMIHNKEGGEGYKISRRKIMFYLLQLLSHKFPRIRKRNLLSAPLISLPFCFCFRCCGSVVCLFYIRFVDDRR